MQSSPGKVTYTIALQLVKAIGAAAGGGGSRIFVPGENILV